jgi:hypothetical protein
MPLYTFLHNAECTGTRWETKWDYRNDIIIYDCTDCAGIVVGVAIGVGCIILCAVAVLWRRRCIKSASAECSGTNAGCGSHQANGNGYYKAWDRSATGHARITAAPSESHELDFFVAPVTANIPCDDNADHLDTKVRVLSVPSLL